MKDILAVAAPHYLLQTAPMQYLNKEGSLGQSGQHIAAWGKRSLVCGGRKALAAVEKPLLAALTGSDIRFEQALFPGECSAANIQAIARRIAAAGADVLVGVGGGKALDAAKAAAWAAGVPVVCLPTIAATCAAVTALSIVYTDDGTFERALYLPSSPNLVIVDPKVIAEAPPEYLASGMFDSLAKWYEGQAVLKGIPNPDALTGAAVELTEFLYRRMKRQGPEALELVRERRTGKALQDVIDLNIFLTGTIQGLGLYTLRGGAAHAVHNGLTALKSSHGVPHGFKVGYGIVVQHFLESKPLAEIEETVRLFRLLGLEPRLGGLGIRATKKNMRTIAEIACRDEAMKKMPFAVDTQMVMSAISGLEQFMENS